VTLDGQARQQQRASPVSLAKEGTRGHGGNSTLLTTSLTRSEGADWLEILHPEIKIAQKAYWPFRQAILDPFCPPDQDGKDRGQLTLRCSGAHLYSKEAGLHRCQSVGQM